VANINEFWSVV